MKRLNKILWGIVFVILGVIFALNGLNVTDIDVFFDGWWTLFIIIPCLVGLFTEKKKLGNLFGIALGVFLLLCSWDVLSFSLLWKLIVPAAIIYLGLKLIFGNSFGKKTPKPAKEKDPDVIEGTAKEIKDEND